MSFNSFEFGIFFLIFFATYYLLKGKARIILCLLASYYFYAQWDARFLSLIIFSTCVDYYIGLNMAASDDVKQRKRLLFISVFVNLGLLAVFKYFNFFIASFIDTCNAIGFQANYHTLKIILPVGISFYTFQTMSYSIDLFRKQIDVEKDFFRFATYVAFFPQLVAGPIVRAKELLPQFKKDQVFTWDNFYGGIYQFLFGLFKKVVVADTLAIVVDKVFALPENYSVFIVIIGVLFYTFQIYCDFSGYSDMAIGLARILGFKFPENFRTPYFSKNFSEFWTRWHITLSSWLRDYLYISLGGNRKGVSKTYRNLMLTMLLGGLWHGANWTFMFWGLLHGLYLIFQRWLTPVVVKIGNVIKVPSILGSFGAILLTFSLTAFAWIFFRSPDWQTAFTVIRQMNPFMNEDLFGILHIIWVVKGLIALTLLILIDFVSLHKDFLKLSTTSPIFRTAVYTFFIIMISLLGTFQGNNFIYFQF